MDWLLILQRILKKPPIFVIVPIVYFFSMLFLKWQLQLPFEALWFFIGGILGIFLLDIVEEFFKLKPSPFRTVLFGIVLFILTIYIVTSTKEYIAKGISISLLLTLLLLYVDEWRSHHTTKEWFFLLFEATSTMLQRSVMYAFSIGLIIVSFLFVLS